MYYVRRLNKYCQIELPCVQNRIVKKISVVYLYLCMTSSSTVYKNSFYKKEKNHMSITRDQNRCNFCEIFVHVNILQIKIFLTIYVYVTHHFSSGFCSTNIHSLKFNKNIYNPKSIILASYFWNMQRKKFKMLKTNIFVQQ